MSDLTFDELIARVPVFAGLEAKAIGRIARLLTPIDVPFGQALTREGTIGNDFVIILEGNAEVRRQGDVLAMVGPGDYQGEISLLDGGPRTASVVATSPMRILVASRAEFMALLDEAPEIARSMLPTLARRVRALADAVTTL